MWTLSSIQEESQLQHKDRIFSSLACFSFFPVQPSLKTGQHLPSRYSSVLGVQLQSARLGSGIGELGVGEFLPVLFGDCNLFWNPSFSLLSPRRKPSSIFYSVGEPL